MSGFEALLADAKSAAEEAASGFATGEPAETPTRSRILGLIMVASALVGVGAVVAGFAFFARPVVPAGLAAASASEGATATTAPSAAGRTATATPAPTPSTVRGIADLPALNWAVSTAAAAGIPLRPFLAYSGAALRIQKENPGCDLGWNTLAGIGSVESDHGRISGGRIDQSGEASPVIVGVALDGGAVGSVADTDGGALDGDTVWDRAVGPMQFLPETWTEWSADGNGDGVADINNIDDSALAAGRYLCAVGGELGDPDNWRAAIAAYNPDPAYAVRVADTANAYGGGG